MIRLVYILYFYKIVNKFIRWFFLGGFIIEFLIDYFIILFLRGGVYGKISEFCWF